MRMVSEIMIPDVQAIHRDEAIREAERVFITENISGAPIKDDEGLLVGFVSKTDIIRFNSTGEDCSGLMKPDTNIGGKIAAVSEVFNEKTASYFLDRIQA